MTHLMYDERLDPWLNVLDDAITRTAADFIAVHLQELLGASFDTASSHCRSDSEICQCNHGALSRLLELWNHVRHS